MLIVGNTDKDKLQQLARYIAHGIDSEKAGLAVGMSASRVQQLMDSDETFKGLVEQNKEEIKLQYIDINAMYDAIEKKALQNLYAHTQWSADPDFNMRAAMLANRANRKGQDLIHPNMPLNAAGADGTTLRISMSVHLVHKAQDGALQKNDVIDVEATEVNAATQQDMTEILGIAPTINRITATMGSPDEMPHTLADFLNT
jgi:hypothetical protein